MRAPRRLDPRLCATWSSRISPSARVAHPLLALALVLAACGGSGTSPGDSTTTVPIATTAAAPQTTTTTTGESDDESTTPSTTAPDQEVEEGPLEIAVEDGEVVGGPLDLSVDLGSTVHVNVTSDVADHVHVHGYDLFFDVAPGEMTEVLFVADVPGIFEVELEDTHTLLMELEVS